MLISLLHLPFLKLLLTNTNIINFFIYNNYNVKFITFLKFHIVFKKCEQIINKYRFFIAFKHRYKMNNTKPQL